MRAAFAMIFVVLLGGVRLTAPTRQMHRPAGVVAPRVTAPVTPSRAVPATPARTVTRPPRSSSRLSRPPEPSSPPDATSPAPLPAIISIPATATHDAPLIATSVFHLSPVPPLPPPPRSIASGVRAHARGDFTAGERPSSLIPLYASFATLQALDYHSTRRALENGSGREANPLMREIVKSPPAFIAVKAAATASVIVVGEKMWKKNRLGAVLFVAGANVALGVVVAKNYAGK